MRYDKSDEVDTVVVQITRNLINQYKIEVRKISSSPLLHFYRNSKMYFLVFCILKNNMSLGFITYYDILFLRDIGVF